MLNFQTFPSTVSGSVSVLTPSRGSSNSLDFIEFPNGFLEIKYPLSEPQIIGEKAQKDFIGLFGSILRMRNLLSSFDEFAGNEILSEGEMQDYLSRYNDLYLEWKKYREIKLEREYARIRNCRRFFNSMNNFYKTYYLNLKKNLFTRMSTMKPKEIEVTAQDYYLIQHLKEMGINSVIDFRRAVASIVNNNN